jgi:hypothetical protein
MSHAAGAPTGGLPTFSVDPGGFFNAIASRPPSRELWGLLSGTTAQCMKGEENPQLCALYLQAVAQQLPASDMAVSDEAAGSSNSNNMEMEMMRAQRQMEILDVSHKTAQLIHQKRPANRKNAADM